MDSTSGRQCLPTLADLIDRLCIDQIKEVLLSGNRESYAEEMQKLEHDITLIIQERDIELSARLLRVVIVLAQMNLHIWHNKDKMQADPEHYLELLKLAHQLNGIRNQMKNLILEISGDRQPSLRSTNVGTDDLKGWDINI